MAGKYFKPLFIAKSTDFLSIADINALHLTTWNPMGAFSFTGIRKINRKARTISTILHASRNIIIRVKKNIVQYAIVPVSVRFCIMISLQF
ncbi:MAG TPA: hypothetical protein PK263_01970 [bacterium]|nr:hypothetical protein [bacterium]